MIKNFKFEWTINGCFQMGGIQEFLPKQKGQVDGTFLALPQLKWTEDCGSQLWHSPPALQIKP